MKRTFSFPAIALVLPVVLFSAGQAVAASAWEKAHAKLMEQATVHTTNGLTIQYVYPSDAHFNNNGSVFSPPTVYIPEQNRSVAEQPGKDDSKR